MRGPFPPALRSLPRHSRQNFSPLPRPQDCLGRSYLRDLSGPGAGLLASLPILTARAAVLREVQPRSSLQLVQYGRLHPDKMLAKREMGG